MKILVKNGAVVLGNRLENKDILIESGRISKIQDEIDCEADEIIDALGKTVLPGFVDMHCHLREPGQEHKEDIESGTAAAIQGGFTSIACMPNTIPPIDNPYIIKYIKSKACETDNAKVYPIAAITKGQGGQELTEFGLMKEAGAIAFSDDGKPVSDSGIMRNALEYAKGHDVLLISHAEDIRLSADGVVNEGLNSTVSGLKGITRVAEEAMTARDVLLAESLESRIHIAHVSTKNSVEIIRNAKKRGVRVTAETCPHYFSASDDEILAYNTNAKINPPLRLQSDIDAIIEGLKDGTIDAIATDHAPHHESDKNVEFNLAAFGTSGFETAFAVAYTFLVEAGHIDITDLVSLMSYNPAKILGLNNDGIKEGLPADITIVDLSYAYTVDSSKFVSKGKNSLFNNWKLTGVIDTVIVDGYIKKLKKYDR